MTIRPATSADAEAIWQIFKAVVAGGDTYAFAPDTPRQVALEYYLGANVRSWVAEDDGVVSGRRWGSRFSRRSQRHSSIPRSATSTRT